MATFLTIPCVGLAVAKAAEAQARETICCLVSRSRVGLLDEREESLPTRAPAPAPSYPASGWGMTAGAGAPTAADAGKQRKGAKGPAKSKAPIEVNMISAQV